MSPLLLAGGLVLTACSSEPSASPDQPPPSSVEQAFNPLDVMFAQMMIPHHEQAVEIAELADSRATDPLIADLAREIKGAQDPEIALMDSWLTAWGFERQSTEEALAAHGGHGMSGMLSDQQLQALNQAQGEAFDTLFATAMIEHHVGAVEMARDVLNGGAAPEVAALAREIVVTQEKEILQLRAFLEGRGFAAPEETTLAIAPALGHVHGVVVAGDALLAGTHDGVHRIDLSTGASELVGSSRDDFMGFTGQVGQTLVASGHPGQGSDLPNPLGLLASVDGGQTWEPRSLLGEVDFHGLAVNGEQVVGWDTRGPVQWSGDAGRTWAAGPELTPTSLTWFGDEIWLATPDQGLLVWTPGEADAQPVDVPGVIVASSADGQALWRIDGDGSVHRSTDGAAWSRVGQVTAVEAFAADADRAFAVTARGVQIIES